MVDQGLNLTYRFQRAEGIQEDRRMRSQKSQERRLRRENQDDEVRWPNNIRAPYSGSLQVKPKVIPCILVETNAFSLVLFLQSGGEVKAAEEQTESHPDAHSEGGR